MQTRYAIFNPDTGEYDFYDSQEAAQKAIAKKAYDFFISHSQGFAFTKVTIDEYGWETWDSSNTEMSVNEAEILEEIKAKL